MSVSRFLAGFIVGGAIGAVAGVLLAPRSGEETRKLLKDTAEDMSRRADETAKQIKVKADDAVSDLQKRGEEIKEKLHGLMAKQKEGKAENSEESEENTENEENKEESAQ